MELNEWGKKLWEETRLKWSEFGVWVKRKE